MNAIYTIPDVENLEQSVSLSKQYKSYFEYNDFFLPHILDDKKKQMEIINTYAKFRSDFSKDTMHGAFFDVTLHSTDPLIQEIGWLRVKQSMDIAKEMNLKGVIFHSGRLKGFREVFYIKNWLEQNEKYMRKLLDMYPQQEIYMENMFDEAPDILAELAERMGDCHRFGICLDYAHGVVFGENKESWISQLAPFIRHIHLNDNNLKADDHMVIGRGKIDWNEFWKQMREYDISSSILIEMKGVENQRESIGFLMEKGYLDLKEKDI